MSIVSASAIGKASCDAAQRSVSYHQTGRGFPNCPRCAEVPGAGVCPAPGTLEDVMALFDRVFVLCVGVNCKRHRAGYWPASVQSRLEVFEATQMDIEYERTARAAGISDLLGLRGKLGETADGRRLKGVWHRIRALLSSLGLVLAAEARGLDSVLIVEGDVRPVPSNQLPVAAVGELRARLSHEPWSVVRLGGHFWKFSQYRKRRDVPSTCPAECTCARPARPTAFSPRFCTVRSPVAPDASGDDEWMARPFCTVKDSVAFAVHSSAYPAFRRARERAFAALQQAVNLSRLEAAAHGGAIKPVNETFGLSPRRFELDLPWFDVWLPARLDNTHVLPSLTVQQIRQGDEQLSRSFAERCSPGALPAAEARARKGGKRGAQRKYLYRNETRRMVRGRGYRPAQGQVQSPGALRDV